MLALKLVNSTCIQESWINLTQILYDVHWTNNTSHTFKPCLCSFLSKHNNLSTINIYVCTRRGRAAALPPRASARGYFSIALAEHLRVRKKQELHSPAATAAAAYGRGERKIRENACIAYIYVWKRGARGLFCASSVRACDEGPENIYEDCDWERERESARAHARFYCDHAFDSMGVSECLVWCKGIGDGLKVVLLTQGKKFDFNILIFLLFIFLVVECHLQEDDSVELWEAFLYYIIFNLSY